MKSFAAGLMHKLKKGLGKKKKFQAAKKVLFRTNVIPNTCLFVRVGWAYFLEILRSHYLGTLTPEGRANGRRRRPICEYVE